MEADDRDASVRGPSQSSTVAPLGSVSQSATCITTRYGFGIMKEEIPQTDAFKVVARAGEPRRYLGTVIKVRGIGSAPVFVGFSYELQELRVASVLSCTPSSILLA